MQKNEDRLKAWVSLAEAKEWNKILNSRLSFWSQKYKKMQEDKEMKERILKDMQDVKAQTSK